MPQEKRILSIEININTKTKGVIYNNKIREQDINNQKPLATYLKNNGWHYVDWIGRDKREHRKDTDLDFADYWYQRNHVLLHPADVKDSLRELQKIFGNDNVFITNYYNENRELSHFSFYVKKANEEMIKKYFESKYKYVFEDSLIIDVKGSGNSSIPEHIDVYFEYTLDDVLNSIDR